MRLSTTHAGPTATPWRHALVTGGTSGIGLAIARELAARGTSLTLVARTSERLAHTGHELRSTHGVDVEVIAADLATPSGIAETAARVAADPPVDLLVNNAAAGAPAALLDRVDVAAEVTVGVTAVAVLTHRAVTAMAGRGHGTVLNIASGTGFYPVPYAATYGASKAFLVSFGRAVAFELRGTGVRLTTACPGFTDTGAAERAGRDITKVPRIARMSPEAVARDVLRAAGRGDAIVHPGALNGVAAFVGHHLPAPVVLRAVGAQQLRLGGARPGEPARGRDGQPA